MWGSMGLGIGSTGGTYLTPQMLGLSAPEPSLEQQQINAQLQQVQQQLGSQQSIASQNNANNLQLASLNNASAQNIAAQNNASNNTLAGIQLAKYNQGLSLLGLLGGVQAGSQAVSMGPRPTLPPIVGSPVNGPIRTSAQHNQQSAYEMSKMQFDAAVQAQAAWDAQNAQYQQQAASQPQGGGQIGSLGQAIAGGGGSGIGGSAQQLLALGLIDPQIASVVGQQETAQGGFQNNLQLAALNNASQLQQIQAQIAGQLEVAKLGGENTLANTGLQNQGAQQLAAINNASQLQQLQKQISAQKDIAAQNNANALQVAGINTAPALQAQQLARDAYTGRQNLLQQILGSSGGLEGLFGIDGASTPVSVALGGASNGDVLSNYLQQLIAGADDQFTAMPPELFQQQLNQILGNSASALGGQLRSAQGAAGGAGMGANSPVARALQNQYGNAANASTQNSLTNAFLGKYNTDFQRQQAQAGYRKDLGNLALGQTTQNQNYGLGLGNLSLGTLQNSTQRRGQNLGLIGQLTA